MAQRKKRSARAKTALTSAMARRAETRAESRAQRSAGTHLSLVRAPKVPRPQPEPKSEVTVATYNVHRWSGINGRRKPDPARAAYVISELDADIIALQEVIRPRDQEDPLEALSDALGLHLAFAITRIHRHGNLGNAILSRFPLGAVSVLDISHSRIEKRGALAARFVDGTNDLAVVATHLSLVDRTRRRQVESLLQHPQMNAGPSILLGDMNAWRKCKATRELESELNLHHNLAWPSTFPSAAPVLALDRVYARRARIVEMQSHDTAASRRASDHLPLVARIELGS
jgi:endonuclease/exonuclease/phosphatase family metal-dependent hydrolase